MPASDLNADLIVISNVPSSVSRTMWRGPVFTVTLSLSLQKEQEEWNMLFFKIKGQHQLWTTQCFMQYRVTRQALFRFRAPILGEIKGGGIHNYNMTGNIMFLLYCLWRVMTNPEPAGVIQAVLVSHVKSVKLVLFCFPLILSSSHKKTKANMPFHHR